MTPIPKGKLILCLSYGGAWGYWHLAFCIGYGYKDVYKDLADQKARTSPNPKVKGNAPKHSIHQS
jgi:hypothetical protein